MQQAFHDLRALLLRERPFEFFLMRFREVPQRFLAEFHFHDDVVLVLEMLLVQLNAVGVVHRGEDCAFSYYRQSCLRRGLPVVSGYLKRDALLVLPVYASNYNAEGACSYYPDRVVEIAELRPIALFVDFDPVD